MRHVLLALILSATAAFVVGVALERNTERHPAAVEAGEHADRHGAEGAPEHGTAEHGESTPHAERGATHDASEELRPFGIDVEATPFVVLAAAVSVLLALAAWLRPRPVLLAVTAVVMLAFAVLDVREVFHQFDESRGGLALLAALVALLHLASATLAGLLAVRGGEPAGSAGTMPA